MTYHFNVSGTDRKNLVKAISEHIGVEPKYLGAPSFAYQVGEFTVSKDGAVNCERDAAELITALAASGFCAEETEVNQVAGGEDNSTTCEDEATGEYTATNEPTALSISLPRSMFTNVALDNLKAIIHAKGTLLKRAFRTDSLDIEIDEEKVTFPWFALEDAESIEAYTVFVEKLCKMAVQQKRISNKEKEVENPKYAFRCFLLRLGFIGDEHKKSRKILMQYLTGNSAFKSGRKGGE